MYYRGHTEPSPVYCCVLGNIIQLPPKTSTTVSTKVFAAQPHLAAPNIRLLSLFLPTKKQIKKTMTIFKMTMLMSLAMLSLNLKKRMALN